MIKNIIPPLFTDSGEFKSVDAKENAQRFVENLRLTIGIEEKIIKGPADLLFVPASNIPIEEDVDYLVDNLLVRGGSSLLNGVTKAGKSTLSRQLVASISTGRDFLGRAVKRGAF